MNPRKRSLVPDERIERSILLIRGKKVILDQDLARIYGTTTMRLNEQVSRNINRFPDDFAFRLTKKEFENLISQFAISSPSWGGRRTLPRVFTEYGAVMAAGVLNTPVAVTASIAVVRTFVRLREIVRSNVKLAKRLEELEAKYDKQFRVVFDAIRELMKPEQPNDDRRIGFRLK